jgi:teichoic acid transport system permease protein
MTLTVPPEPTSIAVRESVDGREPYAVYERTRWGFPPLRAYFGEIWRRRPLIWHLARTDLKAENYDTAAGQLWLLLNPLFMAAVYMFVRTIFRPAGSAEDQADLIAHLIIGVFIFRFVSSSLMLGSRSIYSNRQLVLNTAFPRMIFPLASIVQAVMELAPTILVYFAVHWYFDQPWTWNMLWLPFYLVTVTIFGLGMGLLFAPLCVLYRDVAGVVPYITKMWLFVSPVMYTVDEIPASHLWVVEAFNPAFPWYAAIEQMMDGQPPDTKYLAMSLGWMTAALVAGTTLFLMKERKFAARV